MLSHRQSREHVEPGRRLRDRWQRGELLGAVVVMLFTGFFCFQPFFRQRYGVWYFLIAGVGLPVLWLALVAREPGRPPTVDPKKSDVP